MLEHLKASFWFAVSTHMGLPINLSKKHIYALFERLNKGELDVNSLSPQIRASLEYYLQSKSYIEDL